MNLNDFLPLLLQESVYSLVALVQPGLRMFCCLVFLSMKMILQHSCNLAKDLSGQLRNNRICINQSRAAQSSYILKLT